MSLKVIGSGSARTGTMSRGARLAANLCCLSGGRVIHALRSEDAWWDSFNGTIGKFFASDAELELPSHLSDIFDTKEFWEHFGGEPG